MSRADHIRSRGPLAEAKALNEFHRILDLQDIEGQVCIVLAYDMKSDPCCQAMPRVIQYNGQILGWTGYNSDQGHCYYKTGVKVAQNATVEQAELLDLRLEVKRLRLERDAAIRGREQLLVRVKELEELSRLDAERIYGPIR